MQQQTTISPPPAQVKMSPVWQVPTPSLHKPHTTPPANTKGIATIIPMITHTKQSVFPDDLLERDAPDSRGRLLDPELEARGGAD